MALLKNAALTFVLSIAVGPFDLTAKVVINEIFYNAPKDLNDLQWIEFHNTAAHPIDISEWTVERGFEAIGSIFMNNTSEPNQATLASPRRSASEGRKRPSLVLT